MAVPNVFASQPGPIPLAQLDANFATPIQIGSTQIPLGNVAATINSVTLTNANIASVSVALTPAVGGTGLTSPGANGNVLTSNGAAWTSSAPSAGAVIGAFRNLKVSTTGLDASVTATADELVLENASNAYYNARSVSLTINSSITGVNGLDTGTISASTWYSVWVIYNGTTVSGLLSLSSTAPTLPGGYTYKARIGWIRTDGTGNKYPLSIIQYGRRVQYKLAGGSNLTTLPQIVSGAAGTTTSLAAQSVANFVPSTAARIALMMQGNGSNWGGVAPNSVYQVTAAGTSTTAPINTQGTGSTQYSVSGEFALESTNVYYYSSSSGGALYCLGWEDT